MRVPDPCAITRGSERVMLAPVIPDYHKPVSGGMTADAYCSGLTSRSRTTWNIVGTM
jgi:hypothetical protein